MSSDALLPDLDDVPEDHPASADEPEPDHHGSADPAQHADPESEHATGEEQARENRDRESPA